MPSFSRLKRQAKNNEFGHFFLGGFAQPPSTGIAQAPVPGLLNVQDFSSQGRHRRRPIHEIYLPLLKRLYQSSIHEVRNDTRGLSIIPAVLYIGRARFLGLLEVFLPDTVAS